VIRVLKISKLIAAEPNLDFYVPKILYYTFWLSPGSKPLPKQKTHIKYVNTFVVTQKDLPEFIKCLCPHGQIFPGLVLLFNVQEVAMDQLKDVRNI
jgi:hypothetical protein